MASARRQSWRRRGDRAVRALGWCACAALALGFLLDRTVVFDRAVAAALSARLGALAGDLTLEDADVEWLDRTLVLRGLTLDLGSREVLAQELRLRIGWGRGAPDLERAEWLGGEVVLSRAVLTALQGRAEARRDAGAPQSLPALVVRDLDVTLETPRNGLVELGRASLALHEDAAGTPRLAGRFVPAFQRERADGGEIWITGALAPDGTLEAEGAARALRIAAGELPPGEPFDTLRPFAPEFLAEFEGRGRVRPGASVLPDLDLRLRVADGSVRLPHLDAPEAHPVAGIALDAQATFRPTGPDSLFSRGAWRLEAATRATWRGTELDGAARWGLLDGGEALCEAYARLRDVELGDALLELGGRGRALVENHAMLAPEGRADAYLSVRLPRDWTPAAGHRRAEVAVAVAANGRASVAYHGLPSKRGLVDEGFPLRVQDARGLVTWSYRPSDEAPIRLGLYGLEGRHAGGPVRVVGSIHETPVGLIGDTPEVRRDRRTYFPAHFHLRIESEGLPVDAELAAAFQGLRGVEPVGEIFDTYGLDGGALSFVLQLTRTGGRPELATDLSIDLSDVGFAWRDLPLPLDGMDGKVLVRTDGRGPGAGRLHVAVDVAGASVATHGPVHVRGRVQREGRPDGDVGLVAFEVEATRVNARDETLRRVLQEKQPAVRAVLDEVGVAGFVDVTVTTSEAPGAAEGEAWIEARTVGSGLELLPAAFSTPTRDARGRVLVSTRLPVVAEGSTAPRQAKAAGTARIQGAWDDPRLPVVVVADAAFADGAAPTLRVAGAGLDLGNQVVLGSLVELSKRTGGGGDPLDLDALDVDGRFDFQANLTLPEAPGAPPGPSAITFEARLHRFTLAGGPTLTDVAGQVRYVDATREWVSDRIWGELGATPVSLSRLRYSADSSEFRAVLDAEDLPLDRDHLRYFVDATTLDRLLDDLGLRGTIDVNASEVSWRNGPDKVGALRFEGRLDVDEMGLVLGIPIELTGVEGIALDLVREGQALRAHASVADLDGKLAGRSIRDAAADVSYVAPRLVIAALEGGFEGGRIGTLGARGAQFFAMDLAPPFPFELGARLSDVDVGRFLSGAFNSDFANEGRMDLELRLAGDTERLTRIEGEGHVAVDETRLWAVPLFQAIFARLGFPTTAVFKEIRADFRIADGALWIDRTRADSDLLSVVGAGSIDFEGGLSTDLEVRYGLIDRLGPLRRLLYKIQNSLLRVAVRGTMERPVVVLRGLFSQFFKPADARDRLPLPGFSELPARF